MDKKLLLLSFLLLFALTSDAVCVLTAKCTGGNWTAAGTWTPSSCGGVTTPSDNTMIIIPACATVTVNINSPEYVNMEIYVYGTLDFGNGQKINMCPGYIKVFPGGELSGGTPGSKINICGTSVWNGGTTTGGPLEFGGNTTLPIELLYFNTKRCENAICVEWKTATETNNDFFNIERTTDGFNYESLAEIDGAGNSSSVLNYSYTDRSPFSGTSYYRIKQTDFNGANSYSALSAIDFESNEFTFDVYPNPNNGSDLKLAINASEGLEVLVVVTDVTGKESYSKVIILENNDENIIAFDPDKKLPAGIYFITATSQQNIYNKKMIVN
jgi:hypothetical protein